MLQWNRPLIDRRPVIRRSSPATAAFLSVLTALWLGLCSPFVLAGENTDRHYSERIRPIFRERCVSCHGALKQEGGLRLDAVALMHQGGSSGPAFVASDPDSSALIDRVTATDDSQREPPEGTPLTGDHVHLLRE
ncbi:MAG: c-type cytochrome domain-containing protein [Planctomycetia bacterium]